MGDLLANRVNRVVRWDRLMEEDADLLAPDLPHLLRAERHQVAAVPEDLPLDDPARRHGDQLEHGHRGHGLAAAGLPHYPDALAEVDGYVHAVDRTDHPEIGRAACRESVCQYVELTGVAGALKTKTRT